MCTNQVDRAQVERLDDHALLDLIEHSLATLAARPLDGQTDDFALGESVQRLHRLETMAGAEKLRRIAEADIRQTWRAEGARSTADLLAQRLRLTRGEARAQTETALGLESLPETAAALRAGQIGLGQAEVATRAAKDVRPDVREELDQRVAHDGGALDPGSCVNTWTPRPRRMTPTRWLIGRNGRGRTGGCQSTPTASTAPLEDNFNSTRSAEPQ